MFLAKVVFPVGVEVTVADQGAEFEDGFRTVQAPTGAGNVEPILDQMPAGALDRSEEYTSELQSLRHLVCRLLLEKKKKNNNKKINITIYDTCSSGYENNVRYNS